MAAKITVGPAASHLMDAAGVMGGLGPSQSTSVSQHGSGPSQRAPSWHFGRCSFSAFYGSAALCEARLLWILEAFLLPSDGNCYSFVLCPTTSRPPSCHLCALPHPIPSQGHEMMPKDPSGGFFSTLLDLQLKANCSPDE